MKFSRYILALAALTVLATLPAQARNLTRSASGPRGHAQSQINRTHGASTRTTTWTDNAGASGSHTATRTVDATTQTLTKESGTTLRDGRTTSRQATTTRTESGVDRTVTATGPNGTTVSREVSVTRPLPAPTNPTP
jgi:hypothetical protein